MLFLFATIFYPVKFKFKYAGCDSMGGIRLVCIREVSFSDIEKRSNDQVKIKLYRGGFLMSPKEVLKGVAIIQLVAISFLRN